jgi:hypothetical protein
MKALIFDRLSMFSRLIMSCRPQKFVFYHEENFTWYLCRKSCANNLSQFEFMDILTNCWQNLISISYILLAKGEMCISTSEYFCIIWVMFKFMNSSQNKGLSPSCIALSFNGFGSIPWHSLRFFGSFTVFTILRIANFFGPYHWRDLISRNAHLVHQNWYRISFTLIKIWLIQFDWLSVPLKNCSLIWRRHHCRWRAAKLRPMLGAQGFWAGRDLYHATPAVTRDLSFSHPKDRPI